MWSCFGYCRSLSMRWFLKDVWELRLTGRVRPKGTTASGPEEMQIQMKQ